MNYKTSILIIGIILYFSFPIFPQTGFYNKHEFAYKTVDGHKIMANIFLPKTNKLHPLLIYFHGGFFFGNRDQGLNNSIRDKLIEAGYAVVSADSSLDRVTTRPDPECQIQGQNNLSEPVLYPLRALGNHRRGNMAVDLPAGVRSLGPNFTGHRIGCDNSCLAGGA